MQRDRVNCGYGPDDKAYVDNIDRVNKNCEVVRNYDVHKKDKVGGSCC